MKVKMNQIVVRVKTEMKVEFAMKTNLNFDAAIVAKDTAVIY